jgi:urea carboxylase
VHSASDYWVAALGFWPGLCSLMPLDPRSRLVAPKYDPPRTWTPKGTIGHGGAITCIYPDQTPGGYQIFARTPMPIWDREQRLAAFKDSLALFRPGDRVRFYSIDRDEYDYIDGKVKDGSYKHNMVAYQRFSIKNYHAWVATIDAGERLF